MNKNILKHFDQLIISPKYIGATLKLSFSRVPKGMVCLDGESLQCLFLLNL